MHQLKSNVSLTNREPGKGIKIWETVLWFISFSILHYVRERQLNDFFWFVNNSFEITTVLKNIYSIVFSLPEVFISDILFSLRLPILAHRAWNIWCLLFKVPDCVTLCTLISLTNAVSLPVNHKISITFNNTTVISRFLCYLALMQSLPSSLTIS